MSYEEFYEDGYGSSRNERNRARRARKKLAKKPFKRSKTHERKVARRPKTLGEQIFDTLHCTEVPPL